MSFPVAINEPASPTLSSISVSTSVSGSVASTSSRSSARKLLSARVTSILLILYPTALLYTRDELLALATSPLSQTPAPPAIVAFPMIMRKTRRGVLEAYQTLDYARSTNGPALVPAPVRDTGHHTRSRSPHARQIDLPAQLPPPMLKVDVYVPPARRMEQEQRVRPGRDTRSSRTWRRPAQARVQTQSRW